MAAIKLSTFKGEIPSYSPGLLPNDAATVAVDCHFDDGVLNPIEVSIETGDKVRTQTSTLFRYEDNYWFQWDDDVDVIKSPVARDPYRRVYWTDGAYPKVTYNTIFNGGGAMPAASYRLGVPAPANAPSIKSFVKAVDIESAVTVFYVTTYVTETGEEGQPSSVSARVECAPIGVELDSETTRNISVSYDGSAIKIIASDGSAVSDISYEKSTGSLTWTEKAPAIDKYLSVSASQTDRSGVTTIKNKARVKIADAAVTPAPNTNDPSGPIVTIINDADNDGYLIPTEIPNGTVQIKVVIDDAKLSIGGYSNLTIVNGSGASSSGDKTVGEVEIELQPPGVNDSNIARTYLYRTSAAGDFMLVANLPISQSSFVDKIPDSDLGGVLSTETYSMPPEEMVGLCSMPNGICAGFVDNEILFSEAYLPYAWPEEYRFSIDYDIVAIEPIGTSVVVGTKGDPYLYTGISPGNIAGQKLEIAQACVSKRSMLNIGYAVLYACPDGLVAVAPDGIRLATDNIIKPLQWRKMLDPSTIRAFRHEAKYIGIHSKGAFIFDIVSGDFRQLDDTWSAGFTDPTDDTLYVVDKSTGNIKWFRGGSEYKTLTWRSKEFDAIAKSFSCCRVDSDDISKVSFKLIVDGNIAFEKPEGTVTQTFTLPFVSGDKWQFEIGSSARVESFKMATSKQELKL